MNSIEVSTNVVGCVNRCGCCPQADLVKAYSGPRQFSVGDFQTILKKLPPSTQVEFCGFSEPFLNPHCAELVLSASQAGFMVRLLTTLTGFKAADLELLKQASKIHYIRFHLPDSEQFVTDEARWLDKLDLFLSARIPADYDYISLGPLSDYLKSELARRHGVTRTLPTRIVSRGGLLFQPEKKTDPLFCVENRWHRNALMPNGDVQICCMDFGLKHCLGNLLRQDYMDIYHAAEKFMVGEHGNTICASCEWGIPGFWYNHFGKANI